jgi:hypothetical protein
MRGSDIDDYNVCERHFTMAKDYAQFRKFIAHLRTKERFVANTPAPPTPTNDPAPGNGEG